MQNLLEPVQLIYPTKNHKISRDHKEFLLKQKGLVIWLTGLSGSGKSTLAQKLEVLLFERGYKSQILDGDNLRNGINKNLGFDEASRNENIKRAAEIAKLFCESGIITICSLITPLRSQREMAKEIIGEQNYFEVFIDCPLEVCESRDVKGLYAKVRNGQISNFTGIDSIFEFPNHAHLKIKSYDKNVNENASELLSAISSKISFI